MPNVVFDASSLVGALLKKNSIPERALRLARVHDVIFLSRAVEAEIREVFGRPKFAPHVPPRRIEDILEVLTSAAIVVEPTEEIADCRDPGDNKYLELALTADVECIVASDNDLLVLDPWRGIRIVTPAEYVRRFEPAGP